MTDADRYPITFPFTHIGGIGMLVTQLLTGSGAIALEQYDPDTTPHYFARQGLTIAAGGTPMALLYLQAQRREPDTPLFPKLRLTLTGAAPKPPTLDAELRARARRRRQCLGVRAHRGAVRDGRLRA